MVSETVQEKLLEKLAELEHEQWAHWIRYQKSQKELAWLDVFNETKKPQFDSNIMERWIVQALTPYDKLTEKEKESDREWARKVLKIVGAECVGKAQLKKLIEDLEQMQKEQAGSGLILRPFVYISDIKPRLEKLVK